MDNETPDVGGRPAMYDNVEEIETAINAYFNGGLKIRKMVIGKAPAQQVVEIPVPTITGLAYYLGFESRQSFYDYEKRPGFSYTIKRARLFIEQEYEEQLSYGNTVGAIFALKNMGWKDKTEQEISGGLEMATNANLSDEQFNQLLNAVNEKSNPG